MAEHVVFFDAECFLCHRAVGHLVAIDTRGILAFAPLNGETAEKVLTGPQARLRKGDSLVFAEHCFSTERQFWLRSRAVFRIYWLLGGRWALWGLFSFLPGWIGDLFYRAVARHRHQFRFKIKAPAAPKERMLP